jgi:hypothetical protein
MEAEKGNQLSILYIMSLPVFFPHYIVNNNFIASDIASFFRKSQQEQTT